MAEYDEVFMDLGSELPPEMVSVSQTDSVWYRRLKNIMDTVPKGNWVAIAEGSITHMRVYRSTFRKGGMNIPPGAVFECQVLRAPDRTENVGRLAFRYLGQWDDPEVGKPVYRHENRTRIWFLTEEYTPRKRKPSDEPYMKLDRAGILAYIEQLGTEPDMDEDDIADILNNWEQEHNWTELEQHAAATERLGEALAGLQQAPVAATPVAEQPPAVTQDSVGQPDLPNSGQASEERVPDSAGVSAVPGPVGAAAPECVALASPDGKHEFWTPLQGAPPVCRWCDTEQPNDAPVQQIVQPAPVAVAAPAAQPDPPFPSVQDLIQNKVQAPAPAGETIPGLEDMEL